MIKQGNSKPHAELDEIAFQVRDRLVNKYKELRSAFTQMDDDRSGRVEPRELQRVLEHFNMWISEKQFKNLLTCFDTDGDGMVDYHEFITFCQADSGYDPAMKARGLGQARKLQQSRKASGAERKAGTNPPSLTATQKSSFWEFNLTDELSNVHTRPGTAYSGQTGRFREPNLSTPEQMYTPRPPRQEENTNNQDDQRSESQRSGTMRLQRFIALKKKYESMTVQQVAMELSHSIRKSGDKVEEVLREVDPEGTGTVPLADLRNALDVHCFPIADVTFVKITTPFMCYDGESIDYEEFMDHFLSICEQIEQRDRNEAQWGQLRKKEAVRVPGRLKQIFGAKEHVVEGMFKAAQRSNRRGEDAKHSALHKDKRAQNKHPTQVISGR